jgi:hypothetical protein
MTLYVHVLSNDFNRLYAVELYHQLRENGHLVEIFGEPDWKKLDIIVLLYAGNINSTYDYVNTAVDEGRRVLFLNTRKPLSDIGDTIKAIVSTINTVAESPGFKPLQGTKDE